MANPTAVGKDDYEPGLVETSTSPVTVSLNDDKAYILAHSGLDTSGNADGNAVMFATEDSTAALTPGAGQGVLISKSSLPIGPGIKTLKLDSNGGAAMVTVIPMMRMVKAP